MDSIVINTYARPELLSRCLEALSRQPGIGETELIVVDDGSLGDFKAIERLWKRKFKLLRYIKIRHSGRSAARNRGVRAAQGDRVIFLGDDVIVRPGWLARHQESGRGKRLVAILGPYPFENAETYSAAFRTWADSVHLDRIPDSTNVDFPFFVTGNLSMDRSTFLEIGGFDERFKHYGWEDIDLGYRFRKAGGKIIYDEKAKAIHAHPPMTRGDLWRREFESGITAFQFWDKWKNEDLRFMKFWGEVPHRGSAARRASGNSLIGILERFAPNSALLPKLYERMVYAHRHAGVAGGVRLYGAGSQKDSKMTSGEKEVEESATGT